MFVCECVEVGGGLHILHVVMVIKNKREKLTSIGW